MAILAISTWLCYIGKLDANNYVNLIEWTFAALVAGGGIKKIGESYAQVKGGTDGPK